MARRRYQQGSIRREGTRRPKWVLVYREDSVGDDGVLARRQRKVELGFLDEVPTKRLARRHADRILESAGVNGLDYRPGRSARFEDFSERWKELVMVHMKEGSQLKAIQHLHAHLIPTFGDRPLDDIGIEDIQVLVSQLSRKMRPHSVKNVLGTLSSITRSAKAWGYSVGRWHVEDLVLPRDNAPRRDRSFAVEEVSRVLLRAAQPWRAIFALAAFSALRGGEILGLKVDDIDLVAGVVHVRRSVSPSRALQAPKTKGSARTIPMAPPLRAILEEHLRNTWSPNPDGLLFPTRTGRPMSHTKILEKRLWPLLDDLKIERRGLHAFRHTTTSLLVEAGVPLPLVREIVGHASVATTLGIYSHVIRAEHRAAMEKLGQILLPDVTDFEGKSVAVN